MKTVVRNVVTAPVLALGVISVAPAVGAAPIVAHGTSKPGSRSSQRAPSRATVTLNWAPGLDRGLESPLLGGVNSGSINSRWWHLCGFSNDVHGDRPHKWHDLHLRRHGYELQRQFGEPTLIANHSGNYSACTDERSCVPWSCTGIPLLVCAIGMTVDPPSRPTS
jgi:hypothetical protein